jgi:hypothetical protein
MKKLSKNEINVLSGVIVSKINEKKVERIESKLVKDVDYKRLEKLNKEINELNKKSSELNKMYSEVCLKVRNKFNIGNVWREGDKLRVNFNNNGNYNNIYNEIVLSSIGNDFDVEELVNKIVEKYV